MKEIEVLVTVVDVKPHAQVCDLSIEYKIKSLNDDSSNYYQCHESLLRPATFNASLQVQDNFDTTYDGIVSYEMKRAMVCGNICLPPLFFSLFLFFSFLFSFFLFLFFGIDWSSQDTFALQNQRCTRCYQINQCLVVI